MELKPITNLSKISPPRVPGVLPRPRLIEQIEKHKDKRLLLFLGQAAQGKSTLAASYTGTQEMPTAWLNLDQGDSDPVNLFYWIINAFQHCLPDLDLSSFKTYPAASMGPRAEIPLYREWIEAIFARITFPVQMVLDGLDRLTTDAPSFLFLQTLTREAPPNLRLIMLSREEPPLGLQDLKMKQQAHCLTNDDLAFSPDETRAFFREIRGMTLTASQAAKIHSFTEGWVGGLLLFSLALERLPEAEREKYISEKIPDQFRMDVFRFFGEEILVAQPQEIREFIIKSAIPDRIEPDFIREFTEAENMEEVLHDAARRNLFVQSTFEEGSGWVFRYHQLFRDFLLQKFNTELSPETQNAIFLKAGLLYKQRGRLEEAIKYFLKAGAYELAVSAIEKCGFDLVLADRMGDLRQWLQAFPEEMVQESPWLLFYLSMTRRFIAPAENQVSLNKALTLFEKAGDSRGCLLTLAHLIEATAFTGYDLVPIAVLLAKSENLLNTLGHDLYPRERAILWNRMAHGFTIRAGNPRKGYWACQNAFLLAKETKEIVLQINAVSQSSETLIYLGEFSLAEEKLIEIEKLIKKHPFPESVMVYHLLRFQLLLDKGAFEKADELIQFLKRGCEGLGFIFLYLTVLVYELVLKPHLGQYREAEELGQRLLQISASVGASFVTGLTLMHMGRSATFEGDFEKARDYFQKSRDILSKEGVLSPFQLNMISIWNGFLWRPGEPEAAVIKDLQNALDSIPSQGTFMAVYAPWAMALLFWQQGDRKKAAAHLHSGFKIVREKGSHHFMELSPKDFARVWTLAIELGDQEDSDCAAYLLAARPSPEAEPELERLSKHRDPSIRAKAAEIRLSLHRSALPILKIETLGGFRVIRSGSSVKEEEWHGSQAKNLLKAIVAQGENGVPKEVLIESLWPEGQPEKTENIFNVALHRLRSVLEPDMDKRYGYSYVLLKDNRLSLDKGLRECDVDQFLALLQEGEKREESRQIKDALSVYQEAADLYKGDFLPDDSYAEWANPKREELRQKYLGLLFKMAWIYEDRGAARKAISIYQKAVEFDPFLEEAYRRLMVLYADRGRRNEAIKVYRACEKALREGLDAEPEALTISLFKKIENT